MAPGRTEGEGSIALLEVAGRLGGRVLKLKQLFDELKEVPDTIRSLMEQVAVVESIRLKSSKWKKKTRRCGKLVERLSGVYLPWTAMHLRDIAESET
ncbi:hypothetical protein HYQ46_013351 [Verticillium longisporum]|nr:hypothetical protein HYQ46_013351 [Verticillium longisporum]